MKPDDTSPRESQTPVAVSEFLGLIDEVVAQRVTDEEVEKRLGRLLSRTSPAIPLPSGTGADTPVFVISVAAQLARLHPQTLRVYDRIGLVSPRRSVDGGRRYSARDIERLHEIRRLASEEGADLDTIKLIIEEQTTRYELEVSERSGPGERPLVSVADELLGEADDLLGEADDLLTAHNNLFVPQARTSLRQISVTLHLARLILAEYPGTAAVLVRDALRQLDQLAAERQNRIRTHIE